MKKNALDVLNAFNKQDVLWCHWKSNEHLGAGLEGKTDLDILVDAGADQNVKQIILDKGGVLFQSASFRAYQNIYDALFFDGHETLHHFHMHNKLTLGEKNLKSFSFVDPNIVLKRRISEEIEGTDVYQSCPADELVLLLLREALKIRWRDYLSVYFNDTYGDKTFRKEYDWLKARVTKDVFSEAIEQFDLSYAAPEFIALFDKADNLDDFSKLRQVLLLKEGHGMALAVRNVFRMWLREGGWLAARVQAKFGINRPFILRRRRLPQRGLYVAFIGPDGSGKSTVIKNIKSSWSRKMDVRLLYMGSGDGRKTLLQYILQTGLKVKNLVTGKKEKASDQNEDVSASKEKSYSSVLWAYACVLHKAQNARFAKKFLRERVVTLSDRFPQMDVNDMNDGPRLSAMLGSENTVKRWFAEQEKELFEKACAIKPDIIIKLIPSLEVAKARKPDDVAPERLKQKMDAIKSLAFDEEIDLHVIDADQELEKVLAQVKSILWAKIIETNNA